MAMLLYEAPTGIAIFSFDGDYLDAPVEDFWECLPPLSLEEFIKNEMVPFPIDTTNKAIDDHLAKSLTELCGSDKKLVVGNAEYKRIIEMNLRITCLHIHVPDCEVIICSLENLMYTSLPRKLSNPDEDLVLFLRQHYIDFKPEMVNDSIVKEAYSLHESESREKEHLKFFRLLLKDFLVKSGIDAKNWVSIKFATALKVICYPGASYKVYHPDKIFPCGVHQKIKDHASGFDTMFAKIDVLSVYNNVIGVNSDKCLLLCKLDILVTKAKEDLKMAGAIRLGKDHSSGRRKPNRIDLLTGSNVQKEASTNVDGKLYNELNSSCERQEHDVKQTLTILEENPPVEKPSGSCNEEICNKGNEVQHWLNRRNYPDVPPQVMRRLLHMLRILQGKEKEEISNLANLNA